MPQTRGVSRNNYPFHTKNVRRRRILGPSRPLGAAPHVHRHHLINHENLSSSSALYRNLSSRVPTFSIFKCASFVPWEFSLDKSSRQTIMRFRLFWQQIGVTISRRSAAGNCTNAQRTRWRCRQGKTRATELHGDVLGHRPDSWYTHHPLKLKSSSRHLAQRMPGACVARRFPGARATSVGCT